MYARIADFRHWEEWSPWLEHQADATVTLPEAPDATGACYAWQGSKIGACSIEHVRLIPDEQIEQQLTGIEPFAYRVKVVWTFADRDGKTELTVRFNGRVPLAKRVYARTNVKARATVCHMGYPLDATAVAGKEGSLSLRQLPAHRAYAVLLKGTRSALEVAWYQAMLRMRADGIQMDQATPPFECYLTEADGVAESEQLTELYIPMSTPAAGSPLDTLAPAATSPG